MTDASARAAGSLLRPCTRRDGARVRIAILGGTGSFGRALARRLLALGEDDVVIGSRDADARARDGGRARRRAVSGATNEDAVARRRPRRARGQGRRGARHRARGRGGTRRDAAALGRDRDRVREGRRRAARSGRAQPRRARPGRRRAARSSRACIRSPRRTSTTRHPTRTRSICGDDPRAKELALELAGKLVAGRALDAGPLATRARARGADRGDRQPEPPLQGARRRPGHRRSSRRVIEIIPVRGLPEIREGDDLAAMVAELASFEDGDVVVVAQKAVSKVEGRIVRTRRARAVGQGPRARRRRARSS